VRCEITLPTTWIDSTALEAAIRSAGGPHGKDVFEVEITVPVGCKIMIVAAIRLLSLCNQLVLSSRRVKLNFLDADAVGYLNRVGFFDHLAPMVQVHPARPSLSTASIYRGGNSGVVEIARINKDSRDDSLPTRLSEAVKGACGRRPDVKEVTGAVWTIFAELIDNVFSHSETPLDGYAALQVYKGGNRVTLAVSDSGIGIMKTLRPALHAESPRYAAMTDIQVLVEVFREGLSRHGADRGCGLKGSAAKAMKYRANLDVRLPNQRVLLTPSQGGNLPTVAHCYDNIPLMWGTHIGLDFTLAA
jgi:hypothetical protein